MKTLDSSWTGLKSISKVLKFLDKIPNQEIFVSMLRSKLSTDFRLQLEIMKDADNKWSLVKFRELLRLYVAAIENAEKSDATKPKSVYKDPFFQEHKPTYV